MAAAARLTLCTCARVWPRAPAGSVLRDSLSLYDHVVDSGYYDWSRLSKAGIRPKDDLRPDKRRRLRRIVRRMGGVVPHAVLRYVQRNQEVINWALTQSVLLPLHPDLTKLQRRFEVRALGAHAIVRGTKDRVGVDDPVYGKMESTVLQLEFVEWFARVNGAGIVQAHQATIEWEMECARQRVIENGLFLRAREPRQFVTGVYKQAEERL